MKINPEIKRPLFKYFGSKWRIAPWIISHIPSHFVYVEPFGGGGSVLLRKLRSEAEVYNDIDSEVVNVFRILRDRPDEFIRKIDLTPYSREELLLSFEDTDDLLEKARRTVVRSFMGFAGDSIFSNRASFSVDKLAKSGSSRQNVWDSYADALLGIVDRLKGVALENRDAFDLIRDFDSSRCVQYCDPPYVESTRKHGGYRYEIDEDQHRELGRILNGLKSCVLVSGYPSALYDEVFRGWERHETDAFTVQNYGNSPFRREVLWVKPACK
jgi:DNA adenine methylase